MVPQPLQVPIILDDQEPSVISEVDERVQLKPTRSGRVRHAPRALRDFVPSVTVRDTLHQSMACLAPPSPSPVPIPSENPDDDIYEREPTPPTIDWYETEPDEFGLYRRYPGNPARCLDDDESPDGDVDSPNIIPSVRVTWSFASPIRAVVNALTEEVLPLLEWYSPFINASTYRLMHWTYTGSNNKSFSELDRLVHEVIRAPDFKIPDLENFSAQREAARLDQGILSDEALAAGGWKRTTAKIPLPKTKARYESEEDAPFIEVEGILTRDLPTLLRTIYQSQEIRQYQMLPFELRARWEDGRDERMYQDLCNSQSWIDEHIKIQALRSQNPEDRADMEYVVAPIIAYSDKLQLSTFGKKELWPVYHYPGNLSKYVRNSPTAFAANHIAYIPSVSIGSLSCSKPLLTKHITFSCRTTLLTYIARHTTLRHPQTFFAGAGTSSFRQYGVPSSPLNLSRTTKKDLCYSVEMGYGGAFFLDCSCTALIIQRSEYWLLRIAVCDLPIVISLRMMLACLKKLAFCICPRCYTQRNQVPESGTTRDMQRRAHIREDGSLIQRLIARARQFLFEGSAYSGAAIGRLLKDKSLVPVRVSIGAVCEAV